MFLATIPAVIWIDDWGRKPVLYASTQVLIKNIINRFISVSGAFLMGACHLIVAVLTGLYEDTWPEWV